MFNLSTQLKVTIMAALLAWGTQALSSEIAIVIHGGAGTILKEKMSRAIESDYRRVLRQSVEAGHRVLKSGGSSIDAVTGAIKIMENSQNSQVFQVPNKFGFS